jgi:uncharacterized membrane protein YphA (DoxX/SURF4 family)
LSHLERAVGVAPGLATANRTPPRERRTPDRVPRAKEVPLNNHKFQFGIATVVMLVVLRIVLGWHFLYEGVWKINNPDKFKAEAEGFLTGARGPFGPMFHAMVPDLDGRQRLQIDITRVNETDAKGKDREVIKDQPVEDRWETLRQRFVDYYRPAGKDEDLSALHEGLDTEATAVYKRHVDGLRKYLKEKAPEIDAYFAALDRYQEGRKTDPRTAFQKQRRWDEMQQLRREAKGWITDLEDREKGYQADLLALLDPHAPEAKSETADAKKTAETKTAAKSEAKKTEKKTAKAEKTAAAKPEAKTVAKAEKKPAADETKAAKSHPDFSELADARHGNAPFAPSLNPFQWKRIDQISFALTWGLFLLGLCLMLGFFTRTSALAGGVFMLFVVMSQPSFPGVYPADPPQLGHALLVNKDFVEMIALFLLATTAAGRWGGLDYFIHNFIVNPFLSKTINRKKSEG